MASTAERTANAPLETGPQQQPIYQTPEWETPTARPKRRSLLDRLLPPTDADALASSNTLMQMNEQHRDVEAAAVTKEADAPGAREAAPPSHEPTTVGAATAGGIGGRPTLRQRFDRVMPPYRTYFGRSRRFLLLFVLLPLTILLIVILPLAVGLGVGLSRHHGGGSTSDLPLPSNTETFTGDLTYYGPGLGACGVTSTSEDDIVSVSHLVFDAASTSGNPNANPLCGKKIRIERSNGGGGNSSVDVTVVDRCTGCAATDLDVSLAVFTQLAEEADGRVQMSWAWLS